MVRPLQTMLEGIKDGEATPSRAPSLARGGHRNPYPNQYNERGGMIHEPMSNFLGILFLLEKGKRVISTYKFQAVLSKQVTVKFCFKILNKCCPWEPTNHSQRVRYFFIEKTPPNLYNRSKRNKKSNSKWYLYHAQTDWRNFLLLLIQKLFLVTKNGLY